MLDHVGPLAFEPPLHVVRRLGDQLLENVPRDVLTQAELLGENGIALGPLDHVQEAEIRELARHCCCATEFTTSWLPRVTSTSVTDSSIVFRFEIASICDWLLMQTLATSA